MSSTDARKQASTPALPGQGPPGAAGRASAPAPALGDTKVAGGNAAGGSVPDDLAAVGYGWHRSWIAAVAVVALVVAGAAGADAAGMFGSPKPALSSSGYGTGTQPVTRGSLTAQTQESGTLGDAGSYIVVSSSSGSVASAPSAAGSGTGTFTWLPSVGQAIRQGQTIYQVNSIPVVLLYGSVPAYRDLSEGMTGTDVRQLNTDLVTLGYATAAALGPRSGWDYFGGETAHALEVLQAHLGLSVTGTLPAGQAVFLPGAIRVTGVGSGVALGGAVTAGSTVLTASSLIPVVTVELDASMQTEVAVGSKVAVTLPDGSVTAGLISSVGSAATSSSLSSSGSGNSNGSSPPTITVVVSLSDPKVARNLNQAPVQVTITTGTVRNVLIVPVDALLAQSGGGYAVEVAGSAGHHLVTVTPGLFDDDSGTVQITGNLTAGQRVVVPAT
jgi:hypothetical protein